MPNYRRWFRPGGTFFFTIVTYDRAPFLCEPLARTILRRSLEQCQTLRPFKINAVVLLPDHFHTVWTLPPGDDDFSTRLGMVKKSFTQEWLNEGGTEGSISSSRMFNRRRGVWQRRFWEHWVRDIDDLQGCADYIHYNPVKHGLVKCPHDWPHSTFKNWVNDKAYAPDWQCVCDGRMPLPPEFERYGEME